MNNPIIMKLSEFIVKFPEIVVKPQVFPVVSFLMSQNTDDSILVRITEGHLSFGAGNVWRESYGC